MGAMKNDDISSRFANCLLYVFLWLWNHPRSKYIRKILYNFKLTVICGVITLLVFRGTVGAGKFGTLKDDIQMVNTGLRDFQKNRLMESQDSQHLLWEESRDSRGPYSIGPVIKDWDLQRSTFIANDPGCNETAEGNPVVMIVSGSQPTPCEHNVGDHLLTKFLKTKLDYARIKKMRVYYHMVRLDKEMTGLWAKLPLLRRLMVAYPDVEWFWWVDPDAAITDMKFDMPWKKYNKYSMIVPGWEELVYKEKDWVGLSTGSFLLRNTQWSLDLLEEWSKMGARGKPREDAGKLLTKNLKGRPNIPADDQSALVYLMIQDKKRWANQIHLENKYYLHGYWVNLVDKFESMMQKYKPGYGDDRWPFVIHFVGCQLCGAAGDYDVSKCITEMSRAFNFADNQVVRPYGYQHLRLNSSILMPTNETTRVTIVETHFDRKRLQKAMKKNVEEALKRFGNEIGSVADDNAAVSSDDLPPQTEGLVEELVSGGVLSRNAEAKGIKSLSVVPGGKTGGATGADWRDHLEGVDQEELQEKKLEEAESKLMHQIEGKHLQEEEAQEEAQEKKDDMAAEGGGTADEGAIERLKDEMAKEGGPAAVVAEKAPAGKSAIELGGDTSSEEDVQAGGEEVEKKEKLPTVEEEAGAEGATKEESTATEAEEQSGNDAVAAATASGSNAEESGVAKAATTEAGSEVANAEDTAVAEKDTADAEAEEPAVKPSAALKKPAGVEGEVDGAEDEPSNEEGAAAAAEGRASVKLSKASDNSAEGEDQGTEGEEAVEEKASVKAAAASSKKTAIEEAPEDDKESADEE